MSDIPTESKFDHAATRLKSLTSGAIRLSLIILFSVVAWRIAWSNFSLDLTKFDFSDLLAMILALFAIAMSVAFYFKSTDSSNQFYDNIYNFTQKTSEILGRIEERFGERLKHLDEGYGRIQSQFAGISKTPGEIEQKVKETEGKEKEEKEKLKEANRAMKQMMEQLAQRAKLQQQEKEEFYEKMAGLVAEKDMAEQRIREIEEDRDRMQQQLIMIKEDMLGDAHAIRSPFIEELLHHPEIRSLVRKGAPAQILKQRSRGFFRDLPGKYQEALREAGILNSRNELTDAGALMLRSMSRKYT